MTRPPEIRKKTSSGGVIFRRAQGTGADKSDAVEVAIVSVRGHKAWCLPKGIIDKGEDPPAAALREVREETGLTGEIVDKLGTISYWYYLKEDQIRVHKTVHFFLLRYVEGSTDNHDHEVDQAVWSPIEDTLRKLSYKSERNIMLKAKEKIESITNIS